MDAEQIIKQCRKGRTVAIDDVRAISRRTKEQAEFMRRVFDRSANIQLSDGRLIRPEDAELFLAGMLTRKRDLAPSKGPRVAWNKASDEERARCLEYWQDHDLTIAQLVRYTGRSYSALWNWFAKDYPRPNKSGRPRKKPARKRKSK